MTVSFLVMVAGLANIALAVCPYDPNCLTNPYGAGSPYKSDGLMKVLSQSCFFESFGVCKSLNLREPIFGFYP